MLKQSSHYSESVLSYLLSFFKYVPTSAYIQPFKCQKVQLIHDILLMTIELCNFYTFYNIELCIKKSLWKYKGKKIFDKTFYKKSASANLLSCVPLSSFSQPLATCWFS